MKVTLDELTAKLTPGPSAKAALDWFSGAVGAFGPDAVELIPSALETAQSISRWGGGTMLLPWLLGSSGYAKAKLNIELATQQSASGETGLDLINKCGQPAASVAAIHLAAQLRNIALDEVKTLAAAIDCLLGAGADGAAVVPFLEQWLARGVSVENVDPKAQAESMSRVLEDVGVPGSEVEEMSGELAVAFDWMRDAATERIQQLLQHAQDCGGKRRLVPLAGTSELKQFADRAVVSRASIACRTPDLGAAVDALADRIRQPQPDLTGEAAMKLVIDALILRCPVCGIRSDPAVSHLYLASQGAYRPGAVAEVVIPAGPKVAKLVEGHCPGCDGDTFILTFDPTRIGLVRRNREALVEPETEGRREQQVPPPPRSGCFIATACFGTADCPEVRLLRQFRDAHLMSNRVGKAVVGIYSVVSPPLAALLARSAFLRGLARIVLLSPVVRALENQED